MQQILDIAEKSEYKEDFVIVCDCNFSGNWTYKANEIFPLKKYQFRLQVHAVCDRDEVLPYSAYRMAGISYL